jgi:outer membrane protein OmpA-like peptidoglycan-associated protein
MFKISLTIIFLALLMLMTGCQTTGKTVQQQQPAPVNQPSQAAVSTATFTPVKLVVSGFPKNISRIPVSSTIVIKDAVNKLKERSQKESSGKVITVTINGYCDRSGSDEYNITLSIKRAENVRDEMRKLLSDRKIFNFMIKGWGATNLLNTLDPYAAGNRRVEILF